MPIQQFQTYDLIADIIPGALALTLLTVLVPQPYADQIYTMSAVLAGVGLLLGGFVTGRLLHAAAARWNPLTSDDDLLTALLDHGQTITPTTDTDTQTSDNNDTDTDDVQPPADTQDPDLPDTIDPTVLTTVINEMQTRMTGGTSDPPTPDAIKRYGENLLYGNTTLYHRYETLTTFYRSLTVLLLAFTPIYLLYGAALLLNITTTPSLHAQYPSTIYLTTGLAMLLGTIITRSRYTTFAHRRNHAYINDLHHHLTQP